MRLFTSKISYDGEDRFDITRKSGGARGQPFAPREDVFLAAVKHKMDLRNRLTRVSEGTHVDLVFRRWQEYAKSYLAWIEHSQVLFAPAWAELLAKRELTIVCYCDVPTRCHRSLLATELVRLGACYEGER